MGYVSLAHSKSLFRSVRSASAVTPTYGEAVQNAQEVLTLLVETIRARRQIPAPACSPAPDADPGVLVGLGQAVVKGPFGVRLTGMWAVRGLVDRRLTGYSDRIMCCADKNSRAADRTRAC